MATPFVTDFGNLQRDLLGPSEKVVVRAPAVMVTGQTAFTITGGPILIRGLVALCVTANDTTASTLQWSADPTNGVAATFSGASASLASAAAGANVVLIGTALTTAALLNATGVNLGQTVSVLIGAGIITTTIAVGSTTGTWSYHLRYAPLAPNVVVTAG